MCDFLYWEIFTGVIFVIIWRGFYDFLVKGLQTLFNEKAETILFGEKYSIIACGIFSLNYYFFLM